MYHRPKILGEPLSIPSRATLGVIYSLSPYPRLSLPLCTTVSIYPILRRTAADKIKKIRNKKKIRKNYKIVWVFFFLLISSIDSFGICTAPIGSLKLSFIIESEQVARSRVSGGALKIPAAFPCMSRESRTSCTCVNPFGSLRSIIHWFSLRPAPPPPRRSLSRG